MDFLLVAFMSLDCLLACISCGARGLRIARLPACVIATVGTACLALSVLFAHMLAHVLPHTLFHFISCSALLIIALLCLFNDATRRFSAKLAARCAPLRLHICGLILEIHADTQKADRDFSGTLSVSEALFFALPLSLDSLLTGLSLTISTTQQLGYLLLFSLFCGICAVSIGTKLGKILQHVAGRHADLLGGVFLLCIALWKWFFGG